MVNLRQRLRFELLKTQLVAVRGHCGHYYQKVIPVDELDLNLVHSTIYQLLNSPSRSSGATGHSTPGLSTQHLNSLDFVCVVKSSIFFE